MADKQIIDFSSLISFTDEAYFHVHQNNVNWKISGSDMANSIASKIILDASPTQEGVVQIASSYADISANPNKAAGGAVLGWVNTELNAKALAARTLTAGNGLTGGGNLTANRTLTLGTPSTISGSSTNSVTADSHTHQLTITTTDVSEGTRQYFTTARARQSISSAGGIVYDNSTGVFTLTQDKPTIFSFITDGIAHDPAAIRAQIGAGTGDSSLTIGTTSTTAAAGNHTHALATTSANGFMSSADKVAVSALKDASKVDLTTSQYDTAQRAVDASVGFYGWGSQTLGNLTPAQLDANTRSGLFALSAAIPDVLDAGSRVQHIENGSSGASQRATRVSTNRIYERVRSGSATTGTWNPWVEVFHDGNLLNIGTTPESARANLGLTSLATTTIVPISAGGTGASSLIEARANLGISIYVRTVEELKDISSSDAYHLYFITEGEYTGAYYYDPESSLDEGFACVAPNVGGGRYIKTDSSTSAVLLNGNLKTLAEHLSSLSDRKFLNVDIDADANLFNSSEVVVDPPSGFPWVPEFSIYRERSGRFRCSLDPKLFIPQNPTTVLYVNKLDGSDSNSGTYLSPKKTLSGALSSTAYTSTTGGCIIYISEGIYYAGEGLSSTSNLITRDTAIICPQGVARLTAFPSPDSLVWSQLSSPNSNVYRISMSSFGSSVFDSSILTGDGYFSRLENVSSIEQCQSSPASFFSDPDSSYVYVHTASGEAPGSEILLNRGTAQNTAHMTEASLYCENISFEGGGRMIAHGGQYARPIVYNRCGFYYMGANGSEIGDRGGLSFLYKCRAAHNDRDGFSYRYNLTEGKQTAIEVDCIAENNGWTNSYSNNGSTAHGYSVVIRVNGTYDRNQDRNVHDVHNSRSWNIGCYSGRAKRDISIPWHSFNWGAGREEDVDDTIMWLDSCTSQGGFVDLYAGISCEIKVRRMSEMTYGGEGQVSSY